MPAAAVLISTPPHFVCSLFWLFLLCCWLLLLWLSERPQKRIEGAESRIHGSHFGSLHCQMAGAPDAHGGFWLRNLEDDCRVELRLVRALVVILPAACELPQLHVKGQRHRCKHIVDPEVVEAHPLVLVGEDLRPLPRKLLDPPRKLSRDGFGLGFTSSANDVDLPALEYRRRRLRIRTQRSLHGDPVVNTHLQNL